MNEFLENDKSLESIYRSIYLFGRNVATYKFALAKSLIEVSNGSNTFISLEELSPIYTKYMLEHIGNGKRQVTSTTSKFINSLELFKRGEIEYDQLMLITEKIGFTNVIDAFHNVPNQETNIKFFEKSVFGNKLGISLTDNLFDLNISPQISNITSEIEGRWNLVENAWTVKNPNIKVEYDIDSGLLYIKKGMTPERYIHSHNRINLTPVRKPLNGYQKGKCFYCFKKISIESNRLDTCDVDHFIPLSIQYGSLSDLDLNGVWNLVLSCQDCNRGMSNGKFARVPHKTLLDRLHKRNEYLISSNHPLKETIILGTGTNNIKRGKFLEDIFEYASIIKKPEWVPAQYFDNGF